MDSITIATPARSGFISSTSRTLLEILRENYIALIVLGVLLYVVAAPLIMLITASFRGGNFVSPGGLTLDNYLTVYLEPMTYPALLNTVIYATCSTIINLTLTSILAWLVERTDMPGKNWAWTMMLLPLAMPGLLRSMSWILLLSPRTGLINVWLRGGLGLFGIEMESGPFDIFTLPGMIFVDTMSGTTTLFLMMVGAFRLMDPAMEEAAWISGAGTWRTFRRITLGLMLPAVLAAAMYSWIGNLEDFEVPLLIGLRAGIYVLPTLIFFTAYISPNDGLASAYSTIFIFVALGLIYIYYRVVIRKANKFSSITGKGFRPRQLSLGRFRWVGLGCFCLFFTFNILLPLFILIWASLLPSYLLPGIEALQYLTLENYATLFKEPRIIQSVVNTFQLAFTTATGTMILAFIVSWVIVRLKFKGGVLMDGLAFTPHSIPQITIALSLIVLYLHPAMRWIPIYGTMWIMALGLSSRYLAFATRTSNAAMMQVHQELEEAGRACGVNRLGVLKKITFPLLWSSFLVGWIWVFAHAMRSFSIPLMLATPDNRTISVIMYHFWERKADFCLSATLGVSLLIVIGIITIISRKFIRKGFTKNI